MGTESNNVVAKLIDKRELHSNDGRGITFSTSDDECLEEQHDKIWYIVKKTGTKGQ